MTDLEPGKTYIREIIWGPYSGIYYITVKRIYKMNRGTWLHPRRRTMVVCSGSIIRTIGGNVGTPVEFTDDIPASVILDPQSSYGGSRYRVKYSKKRSKRRSTKRKSAKRRSTKRKSTKRRSKQRKYKKTKRLSSKM